MDRIRRLPILVAEDDRDDVLLLRQAFENIGVADGIQYLEDCEELMEYLYRRGRYAEPRISPRPGLILLDLNMPGKDGREALAEIKADPQLRAIPVVVLTTSKLKDDVHRCYEMGANSYITKPVTMSGWVAMLRRVYEYWITTAPLALEDPGE